MENKDRNRRSGKTKYETASIWFKKAVLLPTPIAGD